MARCLSLARHVQGGVVFFLDDVDLWKNELGPGNYPYHAEPDPADATAMMAAFDAGEIGAFLFDGYPFPASLKKEAARHGFCAEIQDFPGPADSHVIIAPYLDGNSSRQENTILSGLEYALLDGKFGVAHRSAIDKSTSPKVRHVLVAFGAVDSANATCRVLEALSGAKGGGTITVALGDHAPHLEAVATIADSMEGTRLVVGENEMTGLYQSCDMAIGAGGVSMLERMCLGLPSIIVTTSDKQAGQVALAENSGAVIHAGHVDSLDQAAIGKRVSELASDTDCRDRMRKKGMELVDGQGAQRVGEMLAGLREQFERSKCP